jgi:hypothetical protein
MPVFPHPGLADLTSHPNERSFIMMNRHDVSTAMLGVAASLLATHAMAAP